MWRPLRKTFALALFALVAVAFACASSSSSQLKNGVWGGDDVIVNVDSGGAEIEFACAHGRITKPLTLDGKGNFDLPGTFSAESHGPVRDDNSTTSNVRYRGHVEGDTMTLTIVQDKRELGPYVLTRGSQRILRKCR